MPQQRFYDKLAGVTEPEKKRKIIGEELSVSSKKKRKKSERWIIWCRAHLSDRLESGLGGESAVIKSHHNVGGLPDYVDFKEIIEPLRYLFKDEVRKVGLHLGIRKTCHASAVPGPGTRHPNHR